MELLALHGFSGRAAENGREGLQLLRVRRMLPTLILLDLNMPVLDGWGFLLERRKDSRLLTVPVIVMSASTGIEKMPRRQAPAPLCKSLSNPTICFR